MVDLEALADELRRAADLVDAWADERGRYFPLVGSHEIAERTGRDQRVVCNWFHRWKDWPNPVPIQGQRIYVWDEVKVTLQRHGIRFTDDPYDVHDQDEVHR